MINSTRRLTAIFLFSLTLCYCSKSSIDIEKSFLIKQNETFLYDLGNQAVEGGVYISKQAEHHSISEIEFQEENGNVYKYIPLQNYEGSDVVEITKTFSNGSSSFQNQVIRLNIQVIE